MWGLNIVFLDERLDDPAVANYNDGYWDGVASSDDEASDGKNDDWDVSVVLVLKLTIMV